MSETGKCNCSALGGSVTLRVRFHIPVYPLPAQFTFEIRCLQQRCISAPQAEYNSEKPEIMSLRKRILLLTCLLLFVLLIRTFHNHTVRETISSGTDSSCIVIDVGHGGSDPGKVSPDGIREKDVNLQIALCLKECLEKKHYTVWLTRETDCDLSSPGASNRKASDLNNRVAFVREKQPLCLVSIHQNSYPDPAPHGAQTFYYSGSESGRLLAESIQIALLTADPDNTRQIKAADSYFILKHAPVPSVIVECGFLSNAAETQKLTDPAYQKQLAASICEGICSYESAAASPSGSGSLQ